MKLRFVLFLTGAMLAACGADRPDGADVDRLAREYLLIELSMGLHDPAHVDAYFGPAEIREEATALALTLEQIGDRAGRLDEQLAEIVKLAEPDALTAPRVRGLRQRLEALDTRIALARHDAYRFDEESVHLFGAAAPDYDAPHFEAILAEIDQLLGGEGDLSTRVNAFREQFVIPPERLADVFDAAIAECRRRTLLYIELPDDESFTLEYVTDKPWSGYNWYQGDAHSLIQINTDLPIYISRAVDLGCHEGYPGHHTFNALLEKHLVDRQGWLEYTLYPLFSAQSLIAEGSGNYGIDLAFPGEERIEFEREVLFPLAGLDPAEADRYYRLLALLERLSYAGNEAARDYLDGTITREEAVQWLIDYALMSPDRASQRVDFIDTYRSYVINYNLGKDMVRAYVETDAPDTSARWDKFSHMLSSPMLPEDLE